MSNLHSIEELAQAAREQIRDRERMRTFEVYMGRNDRKPTILVEAHFERLVMCEKGAHLKHFPPINLKFPELRGKCLRCLNVTDVQFAHWCFYFIVRNNFFHVLTL